MLQLVYYLALTYYCLVPRPYTIWHTRVSLHVCGWATPQSPDVLVCCTSPQCATLNNHFISFKCYTHRVWNSEIVVGMPRNDVSMTHVCHCMSADEQLLRVQPSRMKKYKCYSRSVRETLKFFLVCSETMCQCVIACLTPQCATLSLNKHFICTCLTSDKCELSSSDKC